MVEACLAEWGHVSQVGAFGCGAVLGMQAFPDIKQQVDAGLTSSNQSSHHTPATAALLGRSTQAFQPGFCRKAASTCAPCSAQSRTPAAHPFHKAIRA